MKRIKYFKTIDFILHTIVPVILGCIIYITGDAHVLPMLLQNHLADGLWAYAFLSCILIIWDRKSNLTWIVLTIVISILFELFQYWHLVAGTGDLGDVVVYLLFFLLALQINQNPFYTDYYERF
ncbi:hypothetical protein [Flavisolibacter ginsengisoli]|jgi:hypothetical protein|uniref:Uncharacterized protein n=1 Tax=Flavisolibacter ginsengisoli DSM 18119 TaxID=1121884 RepID=A0A1M4SWS3_9BACT|nr:hypothetical protein [Flavisolibacter ginsengisoli]SHE36598.1 hypothetical protein SAMN02745131_00257 [Flavisolibacter ginsengisoli DSM 18119]